jgi:DNA-binding response OmpR family regulator
MTGNAGPSPARQDDAATQRPLETSSILVVDDDPVTRTVVSTILKMEDYHVMEAQDGREAIDLATASRPGLMILDLAMPEVGGFAVTRALRAVADLAGLRILILSSHDTEADAARARELGADAFITKPFTSVGLVEVVRQLVGE